MRTALYFPTGIGLIFLFVIGCAASMQAQSDSTIYLRMERESVFLQQLVSSPAAGAFLNATTALKPIVEPRRLWYRAEDRSALNTYDYEDLDSAARVGYELKELDATFYFETRYGSPLAYVRLIDLAAIAGFEGLEKSHVVDFGFGSIGQLKLMARCGAQVSGIEVDPLLRELYSFAEDRGSFARGAHVKPGERGSVELYFGSFPADQSIVDGLGKDNMLFTSKNTLKRGYLKPEREANPAQLIDLGVTDSVFLQRVNEALADDGIFLIYNLHPAQSPPDKPYKPWADGRSPFDREQFEHAGFRVVAFDVDDSRFARALGSVLGWDKQGMDLRNDLFATYTLVRKMPTGR